LQPLVLWGHSAFLMSEENALQQFRYVRYVSPLMRTFNLVV
jgi:hypothetical protein